MGSISFSLLGPLRVAAADGAELEIRGVVRKTLLAALLMEAGRVVSLDRLLDLLWASELDRQSVNRIYNQITRLRHALPGEGDRIKAVPPGYLIEVAAGELDLRVFADRNAAARAAAARGDWATTSEQYGAALALWQGPPLANIPALAGSAEVLRLEEERWAAVLGRGEAELRLGRHAELLPELQARAEEEPERETVQRQLMLALHRSGKRSQALEVYRALTRILDEKYGLEPATETSELHARILSENSARNQLPADTRLFTGREPEVDRLVTLAKRAADQNAANSPGAVTISAVDGLGGVGKSALAIHVAHKLGSLFPDGQLFIELRGHTKGLQPTAPRMALGYLLRSLDVPERRIPTDTAERAELLRERLIGTRTLILLDNAASTAQVRPLLPEVPGCLTLVTSRARLADLPEAHAFRLDVLPVAAARDLLRAAAGGDRIQPGDPALDDLVELCGRIPLALRIIAARLRHDPTTSVASLAAALRAEGERLRNLRDDERGLTDVFESSYAALPEARRRALRLLGLVPGTEFGVDAAAALFDLEAGESVDLLDSLVEHSLLTEPQPGRYRFHDLVRLFARAAASRDESEPGRHAAVERLLHWYAVTTRSAAIAAYPSWPGQELPVGVASVETLAFADSADALDWYDVERENLLAAVEAAERVDHTEYGWLLPAVMWPFTELRGKFGDRLVLAETGLRCAEVLQDKAARNLMLRCKSNALSTVNEFSDAIEVGNLSLKYAREDGDRAEEAKQLTNLGAAHHRASQFEQALEHARQAIQLFEQLGEADLTIPPRINLAGALLVLEKPAEAVRVISRAVELSRCPQNRVYLGSSLVPLANGLVELDPPDYAAAESHLLEALAEVRSFGNRHHEVHVLARLGMLCAATGRTAEAVEHLRASRQVAAELGFGFDDGYRGALEKAERGEMRDSAD